MGKTEEKAKVGGKAISDLRFKISEFGLKEKITAEGGALRVREVNRRAVEQVRKVGMVRKVRRE